MPTVCLAACPLLWEILRGSDDPRPGWVTMGHCRLPPASFSEGLGGWGISWDLQPSLKTALSLFFLQSGPSAQWVRPFLKARCFPHTTPPIIPNPPSVFAMPFSLSHTPQKEKKEGEREWHKKQDDWLIMQSFCERAGHYQRAKLTFSRLLSSGRLQPCASSRLPLHGWGIRAGDWPASLY